MKHRNVTLKFMSITGMMRNMNKTRRSIELKKKKNAEPENNTEEQIEKNKEIIMVELQSEDEKKAEVVRKADNNKEQATKEQTEKKNMVINRDENIQNTKSDGEAKGEDEQYGKPNQQCQKHQKVIAAVTRTKEEEKENQGDGRFYQQMKKIKTKKPAKQIN